MRPGPPPDDVYLDTSLVVAAIFRYGLLSERCSMFCDDPIGHGSRVYFSQILRIEFAQAVRNLATKEKSVPPAIRLEFHLDTWGDPRVRERWMKFGLGLFDDLLDRFEEVVELPMHIEVWQQSIGLMVEHALQAQDAIHLATAQENGIPFFATTDAHFKSALGEPFVYLIQNDQ